MVPDPLQLLLEVQDLDLAADQIRHRRASLPERVALAEQESTAARLDVEASELRARLGELRRSQKRLEDEVATLTAKGESENRRMYSGVVNTPRELQALQGEIDGLARRQHDLEDDVLAIMEAVEPLEAEADAVEARRDEAVAEAGRLAGRIAEAEADLDGQLTGVLAERQAVAAGLDGAVLADYERLRDRLGGVAVARFEGGQCLGCHLSLPAAEADVVRRAAPGDVVYHEECGRILVR